MLYALEAAKVLVRQLKDNDLLGVVAFDVSPFIVVPMESVGRLRSTFNSQIDRLRPGGQTYIYPALLEAKRQLERQNAAIKHVILLSDGETRGSQSELIDLVSVMKNEMKITVSGIAVGAEADIRLMKRVSQYGGGFTFGTPLVDATVQPAVTAVFPGDPAAQAWLDQTVRALNDLCSLASVPVSSCPISRL